MNVSSGSLISGSNCWFVGSHTAGSYPMEKWSHILQAAISLRSKVGSLSFLLLREVFVLGIPSAVLPFHTLNTRTWQWHKDRIRQWCKDIHLSLFKPVFIKYLCKWTHVFINLHVLTASGNFFFFCKIIANSPLLVFVVSKRAASLGHSFARQTLCKPQKYVALRMRVVPQYMHPHPWRSILLLVRQC